jgi:hypothetical protein
MPSEIQCCVVKGTCNYHNACSFKGQRRGNPDALKCRKPEFHSPEELNPQQQRFRILILASNIQVINLPEFYARYLNIM